MNTEPCEVLGIDLDSQTRCKHYHSPSDIVAIKMRCCGVYYACKDCHDELAGHKIALWPESDWDEKAILCGACHSELSIRDYLNGGYCCPRCGANFNPKCQSHNDHYFAKQG